LGDAGVCLPISLRDRTIFVGTLRYLHMEARDNNGMLETWLVRVRGRVQGIGYREACIRRARALGVTGWVRNRMDDSVEAMLQGSPQQLADMCSWLREGMPAALVDELEVIGVQPPFPRFDDFDRLPTL
jgi:acylphosphatase